MKTIYRSGPEGPWIIRDNPLVVYRAHSPEEVSPLLERVEYETGTKRLFAAGFLLYEAACAFNPHYRNHRESGDLPLAQFALYREEEYRECSALPVSAEDIQVSTLVPEISREQYTSAFETVREQIRQGNTYQINLTFRLHARYSGDPFSWFYARAEGGHGRYAMYFEDDAMAIASLSPELFFQYSGNRVRKLIMKPMKGTAPVTAKDTMRIARELAKDPKNRAENLMITDMIRNDAGMIALPGSVLVPSLFETEVYPTVIQMTSTVTADTTASLPGMFSALFPCASITGAPKRRSMEIIHDVEISPRELYTGAAGTVCPDGSGQFNVAIRTSWFNKRTKTMYYGTGGGIT